MKRGMAIPIVLVFAVAMSIIGTFIMRNTRQHYRQNITNFSQLQAHFLARAGMQHALLKVKYLHRDLYDAACHAQGRNPLFDFTNPVSTYNPGPKFLYRQGEANPDGVFTPGIETNPNIPKADKWLEVFRRDLVSGRTIDYADLDIAEQFEANRVLSCNPFPDPIRALMREPFTGMYEVESINLTAHKVAEGAASVGNQAIIEISVQANLETARGEAWEHNLKRTLRIFRDEVN